MFKAHQVLFFVLRLRCLQRVRFLTPLVFLLLFFPCFPFPVLPPLVFVVPPSQVYFVVVCFFKIGIVFVFSYMLL